MVCNGCGNQSAYNWKKNKYGETCNGCDNTLTVHTFDAYFKEPEFIENLADSKNPQGQWVTSKAHKARLMREQGIRESGDRQHGARI